MLLSYLLIFWLKYWQHLFLDIWPTGRAECPSTCMESFVLVQPWCWCPIASNSTSMLYWDAYTHRVRSPYPWCRYWLTTCTQKVEELAQPSWYSCLQLELSHLHSSISLSWAVWVWIKKYIYSMEWSRYWSLLSVSFIRYFVSREAISITHRVEIGRKHQSSWSKSVKPH